MIIRYSSNPKNIIKFTKTSMENSTPSKLPQLLLLTEFLRKTPNRKKYLMNTLIFNL